jgi:DNA processing protein
MPYPVGHKDLLDAIAENGVVASEWPPGRHPSRLRFLVRNRVIAALTLGTLVVEAGERSGALNTARHARDLGRCLMAVPGPVTSEQSRGCHTIIRNWDGILITSADDVLEAVTPLGEEIPSEPAAESFAGLAVGRPAAPAAERATGRPAGVLPRDRLDHQAAAVLDALPARGGLGTTAVAAKAGLAPSDVLRLLGELTAGGFAERSERGWRIRRP